MSWMSWLMNWSHIWSYSEEAVSMDEHIPKFFFDDGTEVNPDLIPKPSLCITCKRDGLPGKEDILCILNRMDQMGEEDFKCYTYEPKTVNHED